nr:hypothetical protein [Tanacetum cinerariifolium]
MKDARTMSKLLQAPTKGYEDAIVIPAILADNFKLKVGLIQLVTLSQFHGFERDDPHAHIRWFNKITSNLKYRNASNEVIKLMLFPFSLDGAARIYLEKEPPRSILTWVDLVSKYVNHFFPLSKTRNLKNDITNFQQRFDESFGEAWDRFKDLLHNCPHQDYLTIIENKSKVRISRNKPIVSKVSTTTSSPSPSSNVTALIEIVKELVLINKATQQATVKAYCASNQMGPPVFPPTNLEECLALADLGASINLMPLSVWKKLSLLKLTPTHMTLKLANRLVAYPVDVACEEYAQVVLEFSDSSTSGNPTPSDPFIATSSPSFTPFKPSDFLLEEIETFLCTPDELSNLDDDYYDTKGDILYLEKLLNEDPSLNLPPIKNEDLKQVDVTMTNPSIEEPLELEFKDFPSHLEYVFLEGTP